MMVLLYGSTAVHRARPLTLPLCAIRPRTIDAIYNEEMLCVAFPSAVGLGLRGSRHHVAWLYHYDCCVYNVSVLV